MPSDYHRIEQAIRWLEANYTEQPDLNDLAQVLGLNPFHVQRLFKKWAGVTPKQFIQYLTVQHAKDLLLKSKSVLEASYEAGLSGPGRLHDQMVNIEAVSPGEFKAGGDGLTITYGLHDTNFGTCLPAYTNRGLCHLAFINPDDPNDAIQDFKARWPHATFKRDDRSTRPFVNQIFTKPKKLNLWVKGTNFQLKVWEALLRIPPGLLVTYGDVARWIGQPTASRAVGTAVGENPISYLIPCHRVIRSSGIIGQYRWGPARKKAILAWEQAHYSDGASPGGSSPSELF